MARIQAGDLALGYDAMGGGEAVVFLHGVGSDRSVWAAQVAYFAKSWRAIALDYPGYGESDLAGRDLQRHDIASYVFMALDALGVASCHVVGLSMGGVIALEMHRQQPQRLRSLTLADSFAQHPDADGIIERSLNAIATMSMREFAEKRVQALLTPSAPPERRQEVIDPMGRIDPATYAWATRAVWTPDYRADLPTITMPTLILVGADDQPTPVALSEALHAGIPHAQMVIISNAGHISNLDNPTAFDAAVEAFLLAQ